MGATGGHGVLFGELLDGGYDCVDRVVLRAYFQLGRRGGGIPYLVAPVEGIGRGSRQRPPDEGGGAVRPSGGRVGEEGGVPVVYGRSGERKEEIGRDYLPEDPNFEGVFLVIVARAPGNVWDVQHTADGRIRRIRRKEPRAWVNHYAFHIMDREWGHLIIRFCPHPPFNALVILNGHEWVAKEAARRGLAFTKQDNCFTELSNARSLGLVAEALSSSESSGGRLVQVSERWIYSAVLCFALDFADQKRTGFGYRSRDLCMI